MNIASAEHALHQRSSVACRMAAEAGLGGTYRAVEIDGFFVVLVTSPELGFLNTVAGLDERSVTRLSAALGVYAGVDRAPALVSHGLSASSVDALAAAGYQAAGSRPLAVRDLSRAVETAPEPEGLTIEEVTPENDRSVFLDTLIHGYRESRAVADFIRAEHVAPEVRGFLARLDGAPIAAAGYSVHDGIAVIGGAATVPSYRGRGAQRALLAARIRSARRAGASWAVATAAPGSASARNLSSVGFTLLERTRWVPGSAPQTPIWEPKPRRAS